MIALHGAWSPTGRLALWTEDPALCVGGVPTAAHDGETPTLHPFCGPTEGIAEWLERDDIDVEQDDICLLLPSTANGPSPSPSLWLDVDDLPPEADRLRPWTVLACLVDADKAGGVLDLLTDTMPAGHVAAELRRIAAAHAHQVGDRDGNRLGAGAIDRDLGGLLAQRAAGQDQPAAGGQPSSAGQQRAAEESGRLRHDAEFADKNGGPKAAVSRCG
jgi:hypothetical protein